MKELKESLFNILASPAKIVNGFVESLEGMAKKPVQLIGTILLAVVAYQYATTGESKTVTGALSILPLLKENIAGFALLLIGFLLVKRDKA